jgi:hypothetical protein
MSVPSPASPEAAKEEETAASSSSSINNANNNVIVVEARIIRYQAYHVGRLDTRREVYDSIDLFELVARRVSLNVRVKKWYQLHPGEPVLMTVGSAKIITKPPEQRYYSDAVPNERPSYNLLVDKLYAHRFFNVSKFELDAWMDEARTESDTILIEQSLPNIAIVREILAANSEEFLMHPVVEQYNPQRSADQYERHNHTQSFERVSSCGFLDCQLCYKDVEILEQPEFLALGGGRYDPEVIAATRKYRERRKKKLKHLKLMKTALQTISMTTATFDLLDAIDQADDEATDNLYDDVSTTM